MDKDLEKRISERAYQYWEEEGRPSGRSEDHWALAREAIALEDAGGGATLPNPVRDNPSGEAKQPVEEAFIQENLGEFPGAYTDQGDREQTPEAQKPKRATAAPKAAPAADASAKPKKAAAKAAEPAKAEKPAKAPAKSKKA